MGILVIVGLVFWPARHFAFVNWDDATYVVNNDVVRKGLTLSGVLWALTTGHAPYWHPVTWMSHMLDVSLFGVAPGAHHVTSVLLHAVNAVLVFLWLRSATGRQFLSLFVGLVFAVHPLHVESVAWVAERKDVLSTCFLLVSLIAWSAYVRHQRRRMSYAIAMAAYALALMSKPMVVTYPVLLLLVDYWPLNRITLNSSRAEWRRLVIEKIPFAAMAAATGVVTLMLQAQLGALAQVTSVPWTARLANAVVGYGAYLRMIFWPAGLAGYYPMRHWSAAIVVLAAGLLVVVTTACAIAGRRAPFLIVGWLWFVVGVLPVSGLVQSGGQFVADRFVYLPLLGILVMVAWGAAAVMSDRRRVPGAVAGAAGLAIVIALAVAARAQVMTWANSEALWSRVVAVTPPSVRAYDNLAQAYRDERRFSDAIAKYETALSLPLGPGDASSTANLRNSLGITFALAGERAAADAQFAQAVALDPTLPEIHINWGNTLAQMHRLPAAEAQFREAIRLDAGLLEPRLGLTNIYLQTDRHDDAVAEARAAVRLAPDSAQARCALGLALVARSDLEAAVTEFRSAIQHDFGLAKAHFGLGLALARKGDRTDATQELATAVRLDGSLVEAQELLNELRGVGAP